MDLQALFVQNEELMGILRVIAEPGFARFLASSWDITQLCLECLVRKSWLGTSK